LFLRGEKGGKREKREGGGGRKRKGWNREKKGREEERRGEDPLDLLPQENFFSYAAANKSMFFYTEKALASWGLRPGLVMGLCPWI